MTYLIISDISNVFLLLRGFDRAPSKVTPSQQNICQGSSCARSGAKNMLCLQRCCAASTKICRNCSGHRCISWLRANSGEEMRLLEQRTSCRHLLISSLLFFYSNPGSAWICAELSLFAANFSFLERDIDQRGSPSIVSV